MGGEGEEDAGESEVSGVRDDAQMETVAAPSRPTAVDDGSNIGALWAKVQRAGGESGALLRAVLANCTLMELHGVGEGPRRAVVSIAPSWAHRAEKWTEQIGGLLGKQLGASVIVEWAGMGAGGADAGDAAAVDDGERASSAGAGAARAEPVQVTDHPLVRRAIELFGGRVVDVQPRRK